MAKVNNGGAIAKTQKASEKKPADIKTWIGAYKTQFAKALPSAITPERFTRMALSAVNKTPKLQECTVESFLGALMQAAQLGLEPNTPLEQAFVLPYYNNKTRTLEAQFQIGYRGMIDLAYRSGEVKNIQAHVVYENDEFDFQYGLEERLFHRPAMGNRGEATYVYAVFKLINGGNGFEVWPMDAVRKHAETYSPNYSSNYTPWKTNFDAMAKKTVLKQLLKYAPLKSEFVRGIAADETQPILQLPESPDDEIVLTQAGPVIEATGEVIESEPVPDETQAAEA